MSAAVLVIVNSPTSGPRRLRRWLSEAGIEVIEKLGQDGLPETLDGVNGLVMLGGGFMPDDDSRAPWLAQERELAREAILRDLPTLGICLGAQILTHVAGAFQPLQLPGLRLYAHLAHGGDRGQCALIPKVANLDAHAGQLLHSLCGRVWSGEGRWGKGLAGGGPSEVVNHRVDSLL